MSNRHLGRTIVLQTLFQWDFNEKKEDIKKILERNLEEFAPGFDDGNFSADLLDGIIKNFKAINELIIKNAPEWPLEQITIVDRNVLRLGIYELKFSKDIPPKVAINEAIELAKSFSSESSGKFVNGVLGTIYKEMEEKGEKKDLEISKEPKEISAGGVIYSRVENKLKFVVMLDAYGKWAFPKGKAKENEDMEAVLAREMKEETGLEDLKIIGTIGDTDYEVHKPQTPPYIKRVHFFLIEADYKPLDPQIALEYKEVKWVDKDEVMELLSYENVKIIFGAALKKLV